MAPADRRPAASLIDRLFQEPHRFDFFQAVRILEMAMRQRRDDTPYHRPVGANSHPNTEFIRFRSAAHLTFPSGTIEALEAGRSESSHSSLDDTSRPPQMTVNFMGLTGPSGVLPQHYTERLIRSNRDSLQAFLDIFNHRAISLFYRAWKKYRLIANESSTDRPDTEPIRDFLAALIGFGTAGLFERLDIPEESLLFYSGHLSRTVRPAIGLEQLLSDYLSMEVSIQSFHGRWMSLPSHQQSVLLNHQMPKGQHIELGVNLMLGDRVWDVGGSFRICVGPVTKVQFDTLMPHSNTLGLMKLGQLTRLFVGPEFDFDVQIILHKDEVFPWLLTDSDDVGSRLGWNTWLVTEPLGAHAADSVLTINT